MLAQRIKFTIFLRKVLKFIANIRNNYIYSNRANICDFLYIYKFNNSWKILQKYNLISKVMQDTIKAAQKKYSTWYFFNRLTKNIKLKELNINKIRKL